MLTEDAWRCYMCSSCDPTLASLTLGPAWEPPTVAGGAFACGTVYKKPLLTNVTSHFLTATRALVHTTAC